MTPREVEQMTALEFEAFARYANKEIRATQRAARKRR